MTNDKGEEMSTQLKSNTAAAFRECNQLRDEVASLKAEIERLEACSINPVATIEYTGYEPSNSIKWLNKGLHYMQPGTKLYTSPPAPVAAVTPQQLIDAIQAEQSRLTAEDYLMDSDDCVAVIREVACLDKVKELNQ